MVKIAYRHEFWLDQQQALPVAYVEHSRDDDGVFIVGGPKEIRALISDLEIALAEIEGNAAIGGRAYAKVPR